jgi:hypothetical protein
VSDATIGFLCGVVAYALMVHLPGYFHNRREWNRYTPSRMKRRAEEEERRAAGCVGACQRAGYCTDPDDCRNT